VQLRQRAAEALVDEEESQARYTNSGHILHPSKHAAWLDVGLYIAQYQVGYVVRNWCLVFGVTWAFPIIVCYCCINCI
jgi:hypothetical protein